MNGFNSLPGNSLERLFVWAMIGIFSIVMLVIAAIVLAIYCLCRLQWV